jgi:hypothetical protein
MAADHRPVEREREPDHPAAARAAHLPVGQVARAVPAVLDFLLP